jgi:hypothetical protein
MGGGSRPTSEGIAWTASRRISNVAIAFRPAVTKAFGERESFPTGHRGRAALWMVGRAAPALVDQTTGNCRVVPAIRGALMATVRDTRAMCDGHLRRSRSPKAPWVRIESSVRLE